MLIDDFDTLPNFTASENWGDIGLLDYSVPIACQRTRDIYGHPVRILNAAHHRPSRPGSFHNFGLAVDFAPATKNPTAKVHLHFLLKLWDAAMATPDWRGLILYPIGDKRPFGFIHADLRLEDRRTMLIGTPAYDEHGMRREGEFDFARYSTERLFDLLVNILPV